jgi:hypothetical protein
LQQYYIGPRGPSRQSIPSGGEQAGRTQVHPGLIHQWTQEPAVENVSCNSQDTHNRPGAIVAMAAELEQQLAVVENAAQIVIRDKAKKVEFTPTLCVRCDTTNHKTDDCKNTTKPSGSQGAPLENRQADTVEYLASSIPSG